MTEILQALSPGDMGAILAILGTGGGVAIVLQIVKHLGKLQEAKKTVIFLLGLFSFVASFAEWAVLYGEQNPASTVGANLGWIITAAVFLHRFTVSPVFKGIVSFLTTMKEDKALANAYRQVNTPQPTMPLIPTAPQEFSLQ